MLYVILSEEKLSLFLQLAKESIRLPSEAKHLTDILFAKPFILSEHVRSLLREHRNLLQTMLILVNEENFSFSIFKEKLLMTTKLKGKALFMPLRLSLMGESQGPDLKTIFELLGPKEIISRLKHALN